MRDAVQDLDDGTRSHAVVRTVLMSPPFSLVALDQPSD
jgi:hypothetical protein